MRRLGNCYISESPAFLEYLHIIAEETCGRTVPRSRLCALALLEHMAAVPEEDKVSSQTIVIETVTSLEVKLATGGHEVRKAPLIP